GVGACRRAGRRLLLHATPSAADSIGVEERFAKGPLLQQPPTEVLLDRKWKIPNPLTSSSPPAGSCRSSRIAWCSKYTPRDRVDLPAHALIPGLVNTHTHNPMTLLRGLADDLPLMQWLQEHIWPVEAKVIGPEFVRDGVELAIAEMLRGGTTCCSENYFFPDTQAQAYKTHGFR